MVIQSDETSPAATTTAITQILPQYKMVRISRVYPTPWSVCKSAGTGFVLLFQSYVSESRVFRVGDVGFWCCHEVGLNGSTDA